MGMGKGRVITMSVLTRPSGEFCMRVDVVEMGFQEIFGTFCF